MEGPPGRPKSARALIRGYAAGASVSPEGDLADAMFLHAHPGWSWRDLQDAPAQVVEYLRMIDYEIVKRAERTRR